LPGRVCSTEACPTLNNLERMVCVHKIFLRKRKFAKIEKNIFDSDRGFYGRKEIRLDQQSRKISAEEYK
jgi:hypothetical protein